ncbi:MAG TPA: hypothetical protein VII58_07795 [Acidobacteriaceae bacterium]
MTTYFIWIESTSAPAGHSQRKITFAVEQLPAGPVQRLPDLRISDDVTARRCELLRQQNGIQVAIEGEHTLEFIVDRALAKVGQRDLSRMER